MDPHNKGAKKWKKKKLNIVSSVDENQVGGKKREQSNSHSSTDRIVYEDLESQFLNTAEEFHVFSSSGPVDYQTAMNSCL
eukprot:CAMPEP_0170557872 /NCGR_PEP_ID=MMETSP0211-20121228/30799_1 /TAXON_ID=311385 /ORGANISM="Pseudokeronopsis sp., Strain OXSARD2" /LENGTH=79 /DNA_ID=CAMNT_0010869275 /DNA_START=223 /DNA_END=465 /DNA_ORIENTATION=+